MILYPKDIKEINQFYWIHKKYLLQGYSLWYEIAWGLRVMQKAVKSREENDWPVCCNPVQLIYNYRKRKVHNKTVMAENGKDFFVKEM